MPDLKEPQGRPALQGEIEKILRSLTIEDLFEGSVARQGPAFLSSILIDSPSLNTLEELVQWLDDIKAENHFFVKREGLNMLEDWCIDPQGYFSHKQQKFFKVVGMKISSPFREVRAWSQPILDNEGSGILGLLLRRIGQETYYLMQAKAEAGNRNIVQIGPTVQFNPGNYIVNSSIKKPFLFNEFISPEKFIPVFESRQSEEGGRFYQEEHIHRILLLPEGADPDLPPEYKWFSRDQIRFFLHMGDMVNSCARSILACLV